MTRGVASPPRAALEPLRHQKVTLFDVPDECHPVNYGTTPESVVAVADSVVSE